MRHAPGRTAYDAKTPLAFARGDPMTPSRFCEFAPQHWQIVCSLERTRPEPIPESWRGDSSAGSQPLCGIPCTCHIEQPRSQVGARRGNGCSAPAKEYARFRGRVDWGAGPRPQSCPVAGVERRLRVAFKDLDGLASHESARVRHRLPSREDGPRTTMRSAAQNLAPVLNKSSRAATSISSLG